MVESKQLGGSDVNNKMWGYRPSRPLKPGSKVGYAGVFEEGVVHVPLFVVKPDCGMLRRPGLPALQSPHRKARRTQRDVQW